MSVSQTDPTHSQQPGKIPSMANTSQVFINAQQIASSDILITSFLSLVFFAFAFNRNQWQLYLFGGAFFLGILASSLSSVFAKRQKPFLSILTTILTWCVLWITISALTNGVGVLVAIIITTITIMVAAETLDNRQTSIAVVIGVAASILSLTANYYLDLPRIDLPLTFIFFPIILAGLLIAFTILMIRRFQVYSLQIKLITLFFTITLIPLGIVAFIYNNSLTSTVTQKSQESLMIGASQTAASIDQFIATNLEDIQREALDPTFTKYLSSGIDVTHSAYQKDVELLLANFREKDRYNITSYAILSVRGEVVYDVNPNPNARDESTKDYFNTPMKTGLPYMSPVEFTTTNGQPSIFFSAPIKSGSGLLIGVLRERYDAAILQQIVDQYNSFLGPHSSAILLDENSIRLADGLTPDNVFKSIIPLPAARIQDLKSLNRLPNKQDTELSTNFPAFARAVSQQDRQSFFSAEMLPGINRIDDGAILRIKARNWSVAFLQDRAIFMTPITRQMQILIFLVSLIAGLVTAVAIGVAYFVSRPIRELTDVSLQVSAGDLNSRAIVRSSDEIGVLGQSFNSMTIQLQTLIGDLENRVAERTHDLELESERNRFRAAQLQTVADVARAIASVHNLESVLSSVTQLINERFGFYHVGIFLLDEENEYAVLRAANSEGGKRMLARSHRLRVGQIGIVGYVTGKGEPRIATDVGVDAVYFNNPDLPNTRSEMALPLLAGSRVIGALDVQSTESNAFSEDDIELFKTLADQVAIALENNRLFAETNEALQEAQKLHRQYLRQEWGREISERRVRSISYSPRGIFVQPPVNLPEIQQAYQSGEIATLAAGHPNAAPDTSALAVPIKLRGEIIGVIDFQDKIQQRVWSGEEIQLIQRVADQIAVALENVRLFEQTVRKAEREQKVLEITGKIRSNNDPQAMLQTALSELQKALNTSQARIILKTPLAPAETAAEPQVSGANGHHPGFDNQAI